MTAANGHCMSLVALRRTALVENVSIDDRAVLAHTGRPPRFHAHRSEDHRPKRASSPSGAHPYRDGPEPEHGADRGEEAILYSSLVVIGLIPIEIALATGAKFGAEATIGILMVGAGLWGLWAMRRYRHPPR
jgi:hypothetical protein